MKYLRKVIGITRIVNRKNEDIRLNLNTKSLKLNIEKKRLKWAGDIVRMKEEDSKECAGSKKNRKGRQRTAWNNIELNILNIKNERFNLEGSKKTSIEKKMADNSLNTKNE